MDDQNKQPSRLPPPRQILQPQQPSPQPEDLSTQLPPADNFVPPSQQGIRVLHPSAELSRDVAANPGNYSQYSRSFTPPQPEAPTQKAQPI
jgi:hypothetical protein